MDNLTVFPTVMVDLGPLGRHPLLYRNRELAELEQSYGSLAAMSAESEAKPFSTVPVVLALGLRHREGAPTLDDLMDLTPAVLVSDALQEALSRAIALALGVDPDAKADESEDPQ